MKMSKECFQDLKLIILKYDSENIRSAYIRGDFPNATRVHDLNERFRWDLYWQAVNYCSSFKEFSEKHKSELKSLNDDHIDTALKKIVPKLQRK